MPASLHFRLMVRLLNLLVKKIMEYITTTDSQYGKEINIAYSDYGTGDPVVLIHGWPLSREMWEYQLNDIISAGYRVVKYDRRGFGKSSKPWEGYNYDAFAADLNALIEQLDLRNVTLVGFSMGGGEVVRYLNNYGSDRVSRIALIASVLPYLSKAGDNRDGVDPSVFEEMKHGIKKDRIDFIQEFSKKFFGVTMVSHPVSSAALDYYRMLASFASQRSTLECITAFAETDFRTDVQNISVPTLIIHGNADKIVPIELSSDKVARMIAGSQYLVYEGAPHGLFLTHRDQLNKDLVNFIGGSGRAYSTALAEMNEHDH
jgi:non-heme chloroperoxidase